MSANFMKQTPWSSNVAKVSQFPSIPNIIQSLKSSFHETEFKEAEREIMAREESLRREKDEIVGVLRDKIDAFEAELGELKTQKYLWEEERRRLRRESEVNDDKLKDLARELGLMKDKEEKAVKRYNGLLEQVKEWEIEETGLIEEMADLRDVVEDMKRNLRDKEGECDVIVRRNEGNLREIEAVRRENGVLEEEKAKFDTLLEEVKREMDERIRELLKEVEIEKGRFEVWWKEVEGIRRRNVCLEEEKVELKACCEELRRNDAKRIEEIKGVLEKNEVLEREKWEILREKDQRIQELEKEKEGLVMEKREVTAKMERVEERLLKLEGEVITTMCLDLRRDARFSCTPFGKIISGILKALDSEEIGLTCNAQEADSAFVSHVNESEGCLKADKQSEEAVRRTLVFEPEIVNGNGVTGKKGIEENGIIIVDSDDDDDDKNPLYVSSVKRKHGHPENLSDRCNLDSSSIDDNLHLKYKKKKLEHVPYEPVKHVLSTPSAARDGHKFNILQRQTLATIRKCEEKLRRDVGEPRSGGYLDDDGREDEYSNYNYGNYKADKPWNPRLEEYMATRWQRKENKKLEYAADMFCAFDEDTDFCAKAVCALYRQHNSQFSLVKGSICVRSKGLEECDVDRGITLAKFLIDDDPKGKMKKSVDELLQHDTQGLDDCRKLAKKYSKQLIDIYKKAEDPLFSVLSADLQYK